MRRAMFGRASGIRPASARGRAIAWGLADALLAACGGTTGHGPVDFAVAPETTGDAGITDATVVGQDASTGAFDVAITYVDQVLPDIGPPVPVPEGGAMWPWPTCPPFLPADMNGVPLDATALETNQIPAAYDSHGNPTPAPDGSPCASYDWLAPSVSEHGQPIVDQCVASNVSGGATVWPLMPLCNWCAEAGVATAGPGAIDNASLYTLCLDLYACMSESGCGQVANPNNYCLCGDASDSTCPVQANGPCKLQELAATNTDDTMSAITKLINNYANVSSALSNPYYCGSTLNAVYQYGIGNQCFPVGNDP
jgi:hypothetical protein